MILLVGFLGHLAYMPNEPMQSCFVHRCHCRWQGHLCTAVQVTALIIETSYLAHIRIYAPDVCT